MPGYQHKTMLCSHPPWVPDFNRVIQHHTRIPASIQLSRRVTIYGFKRNRQNLRLEREKYTGGVLLPTQFQTLLNWPKRKTPQSSLNCRLGGASSTPHFCIIFCFLHELHEQCMQVYEEMMRFTRKSENTMYCKSGFTSSTIQWEIKEYYGIFCFRQLPASD